jgi:hypothetical protein
MAVGNDISVINGRGGAVEKGAIFLAVLASSDGHISHVVAIHDGFIYDANKAVALPSNQQEALDYCTSTATTKESKFVYFCRGLLFPYTGQAGAGLHDENDKTMDKEVISITCV